MNRRVYLKTMALIIMISMNACQSNEEELSPGIPEGDWKPIELGTDGDQYIVARHTTDDNKISMQFLEMEGSLAIDIVYSEDADEGKLTEYRNLIAETQNGTMSFDEMYAKLAGVSKDLRSIERLKRVQEGMRNVQSNAAKVTHLSEEEADELMAKTEKYIQAKYGITPSSSAAKTQSCPLSNGAETWFRSFACDLNASSNNDVPKDPSVSKNHNLDRCFTGNGTSIHPNNYSNFYKFWAANPYYTSTGSVNTHTAYLFNKTVYLQTPLSNGQTRALVFINPSNYAIRTHVYSSSSTCNRVLHSVITAHIKTGT